MKFVIVTGMSGAGKSTAIKMLEDLGFFCVDNLPVPLMSKFLELASTPGSELSKVAAGVDIRTGLSGIEESFSELKEMGYVFDILFLDADDECLIKRFKETRRSHPLVAAGRVEDGLRAERSKIEFLKRNATYIIDTSHMLTRELKAEIDEIYSKNKNYANLFITVLSFGYKYGIPRDSDLVFDVRFLPNPFYIEELKRKCGNDKEVQDFVMGFPVAGEFLDKLDSLLQFLIPNYVAEGKNQLVISIGCTGGKHRSVTLANKLYERLSRNGGYGIKIEHRDLDRR